MEGRWIKIGLLNYVKGERNEDISVRFFCQSYSGCLVEVEVEYYPPRDVNIYTQERWEMKGQQNDKVLR